MAITFRPVKAGTTDVSVVIRIVDSTDGTPETGVVYNTSGIDIRYRRDGATDTAITEATLAALNTAHTDGGFLHIGNGYYRVDLPDAAVAAGSTGVLVHGTVTGMVVIGCYVPLVAFDPYDTVRLGLTTLPNVASGNPGAIPTVGTGTAQISLSGGRAASDVTYWNGAVLTGKTGAFPEFGIVDSGTAQSATGTTLVLRSAAAFADDELNGATILIVSASTGAGQRRLITDYVGSTDTATVDTWTTTPTGTIVYAIFGSPPASSSTPIPSNVTHFGGTAGTFSGGRPEVNTTHAAGTAWGSGAITAASIATDAITAAKIATDAIGAAELATDAVTEIVNAVWAAAARTLTSASDTSGTTTLLTRLSSARAGYLDNLSAGAVAQASALSTVAGYLDTEIAAILALLDDPRTEPGQGTPPVNPDLATKIDYLYKAWRNRSTQTASQYTLYADNGTTVDQKATVSDNGTTFDRGEIATGP